MVGVSHTSQMTVGYKRQKKSFFVEFDENASGQSIIFALDLVRTVSTYHHEIFTIKVTGSTTPQPTRSISPSASPSLRGSSAPTSSTSTNQLVDPIRPDPNDSTTDQQWMYVLSNAWINYCGHQDHNRASNCGGSLASITNQQELDYVHQLAQISGNEVWIGAKETSTTGVYEWVDGTPHWYGSFKDGETFAWEWVRMQPATGKYVSRRGCNSSNKRHGVYIVPVDFANRTKYPNCDHTKLETGRPLDLWETRDQYFAYHDV